MAPRTAWSAWARAAKPSPEPVRKGERDPPLPCQAAKDMRPAVTSNRASCLTSSPSQGASKGV